MTTLQLPTIHTNTTPTPTPPGGFNCTATPSRCTIASTYNSVISIMALLSAILCIITLSTIIYLKMHRRRSVRFVMYIVFSELCLAISWTTRFIDFNSVTRPNDACLFLGFALVVTDNWITFWNLTTSLFITLTVIRPYSYRPNLTFEVVRHAIVWPLGVLLAAAGTLIAPLWTWYGTAANTICFISDRYSQLRVFFVHTQVGVIILLILILYTTTSLYAFQSTKDAVVMKKDKDRKTKKIVLVGVYPVIYTAIWLPMVVVRMYQATGGVASFELQLGVVGLLPCTGMVSCVWYIYSRNIYREIRNKFRGENSKIGTREASENVKKTSER